MNDKLGIARPWLFRAIRGTEMLGLLTLLFGLASSRWLVAGAGAVMIVAAIRVFRLRFPVVERKDGGSMGMSDGD
jgi:hypothetical protein